MINKGGKGGAKGSQTPGKKRFKRSGAPKAKGGAAGGPRKQGGPKQQQRKPQGAQGARSKSNQRSIDWNPMTDMAIRQPVSDQAAMTFEERKAAQLAKWRKELGLDD